MGPMSSTDEPLTCAPAPRRPTVFLSYASEDRAAAQALRDTLPALGIEVWYDESALTGGDAWDQKIHEQIRTCDYFMPVISAQTVARVEGYFRREWRFAVERNRDMADDHLFLLPVVIDDTPEDRAARVPDKFLAVQWTRVPGGLRNPALEALSRRMLAGDEPLPLQGPRERARAHPPSGPAGDPLPAEPPPGLSRADLRRQQRAEQLLRREQRAAAGRRPVPDLPREEPGQRGRFYAQVLLWALQSGWILFGRFPWPVRWLAYLWLIAVVMSHLQPAPHSHLRISDADNRKLQSILERYSSADPASISQLTSQIAQAFGDDDEDSAGGNPVLMIPFSAPAGDADALRLANTTFAQLYGRLAISHHGHVGLIDDPPPALDPAQAAQAGRAHHSTYVLYGSVQGSPAQARLTVTLVAVEDGSVRWSGSYPAAGADPAAIATEVDTRERKIEDQDDD